MSKFVANCVVMGVKSKPSQDGTRTYRTAMLYFDDDTTSLEASISDEHEHLYKLMEANKMKPGSRHGESPGVQRPTVHRCDRLFAHRGGLAPTGE